MHICFRRASIFAVVLLAVFALTACIDAPELELPPVPTYSDETPLPKPTDVVEVTPPPSVKPSAAPIVYNTPSPTAINPTPVPTVHTELPFIEITDATLPENMVQYNVATLHGHIVTNKGNLVKVSAKLSDSNGNIVQECSFQPMQANFSLAGTVNAQLRFAELQPGEYRYVLVADAQWNGINTQKELINHGFTVFASEEQMKLSEAEGELAHTAKITHEDSDAGRIWNFLIVYLDNPYGAAGIMGNIDVESQCNPQRVQGDLSTDFAFSENYTAEVDAGNINRDSFIYAIAGEGYGSGYGLCQWSFDRKEGLYDLAKDLESSVGDLDTQCIYLIMELEMNYPELLHLLKTTDDARLAAREFFYKFEQGAEMGNRQELAEDYLARFSA